MTNTLAHPLTTGLAAIARRYAEDPDSWPLAPRFSAVERWYARIGGDDTHEAWLLTWLPGQGTDLHDHGGSSGAFVVVSGALTEEVIVRTDDAPIVPRRVSLSAGVVRAFGARHVHRITNTGTAPAVSLHVYAPALREMTRYHLDEGTLHPAVVEKAGVDW
jgi:mannose-6-phosphate isomerase-like protein (cupin superfamily)